MQTESVGNRAKRLLGKRALVGWGTLVAAWVWHAAEAVSTLDFLTRRLRSMVGVITSHPTLAVTVGCTIYLSAVVVWPHKPGNSPAAARPSRSPLIIDNVVVQECLLGSGFEIRSGSAYKAILIDFFNDPRVKRPVPVQSLSAKVTFYDHNGGAYATVANAHWKLTGTGPDELTPGSSAALVLAITECTNAAFTVEERYVMGIWRASRIGLNPGRGTALVRVSHIVEGQRNTQEFRFSLLLQSNPEIRQIDIGPDGNPGTA